MSFEDALRDEATEIEALLRRALDEERARADQLEDDLARTLRSQSFRIGHMVTIAARHRLGRALWPILPRRYRTRLMESMDVTLSVPPPGRILGWGPSGNAETVVFVSIHGDEQQARWALEKIRLLEEMVVAVKPVVLSDTVDSLVATASSLVIEHVISFDDWKRFRPAGEWGEYLARRTAAVLEEYGPATVISMSPSDEPGPSAAAVLGPVIRPAMGRSETNLV
jgi:hypothetical protein